MTYYRYQSFPHRTLCDILVEMRKTYESRNFAGLLGLVEEAQTKANRMEAALGYAGELPAIEKKRQEAKDALRKIEHDIHEAEVKLARIKADLPTKAEKKQLKQKYKESQVPNDET